MLRTSSAHAEHSSESRGSRDLSPRTRRLCEQNVALRQYLVQLDAEFQSRRKQWADMKIHLESQATRLYSLARMSRFFMRKVSFKIRDARQLHLKGRCFSGWSKVT